MTEQEKQEIVDETTRKVVESLKGVVIREDTQKVLSNPRNKWFRCSVGKNNDSPMHNEFGNITYWQVWELIRKLTCYICGVGYVRNLESNDNAEEVCEKLCQAIYDIKLGIKEESK